MKHHKLIVPIESELDYHPDLVEKILEFKIPSGQASERIDSFLTRSIQNATRSKVQKAIDENRLYINGKIETKASRKIKPNDLIICHILKSPPIELIPQNIPLEICYEDEYLLVVNKPAGMVTHPGVGNRYGTLVNALIYYMGMRDAIKIDYDDEEEEPNEGVIYASAEVRPGIVHRLDKDTSGLLIIAKSPEMHAKLQKQFNDRTISREYNAIAWGKLKEDSGTIIGDIGRSPMDRKKFAIVKKGGKHAITDFWVLNRFDFATLLKLKLRTGRTHQIRVHLSSKKHPVLGDTTYGGDKTLYSGSIPQLKKLAFDVLKIATRQMLHARKLSFIHPVSNERVAVECALPNDFKEVISLLESV